MKKLAINWWDPIVKNHLDLIQKRPNIRSKDMIDMLNLFEIGKVSWRNSDIIENFENKVKNYIWSNYASGFSSGTA
jgi:hypothetical protein